MSEEEKPTNDEDSQLSSYRIELESFQGPLDLLLHLIRKNELDIYDIPIAEITSQYLGYLDIMRDLDLEVASEFLVMAATLMYIKSRTLLPVDEEEDEGEVEDPREELIRRLIEYKKYKKAAEDLAGMPVLHHDIFLRPETDTSSQTDDVYTEATIFQLMDAFQRVLSQADRRTPVEVTRESFTLEEGIKLIESRLTNQPSMSFAGLFSGLDNRMKIVTVFLSVLELIRRNRLIAVQADHGDPISLVRSGEPIRENSPHEESERENLDDR
ncbi:MAG: segregation/condensation protein A [bacterium]|nr:segregation/condensation protein A [bacterium]MDT8367067.1 segregation/condensation protein A [bacterium]